LSDATDALIARIDATIDAPPRQVRYIGAKRVALTDFPYPAYDRHGYPVSFACEAKLNIA
jgi:hypothetical protein